MRDGVEEGSIRYQKMAGRAKRSLLFMVDTSGSVVPEERLAMVKGCVTSLLHDSYVKRMRVAVIAFGGVRARLVLPFTASAELAATCIEQMPGGGSTPLLDACGLATGLVNAQRGEPVEVVLLSDGRYNRAAGVLTEKSLAGFGRFCAQRQVPIHFIDTGAATRTASKRARSLAQLLHADYRRLDDMRAEALVSALND